MAISPDPGAATGRRDPQDEDFAWVGALRDERRRAGAPPITAVVHTLDEEAVIAAALSALQWCDELLVVDMHSEDRTVAIAESLGARVVQHERTGYVEPARNFGISSAAHRWVLVCDADERIPETLARDLTRVSSADEADVVSIPKVSRLCGRWMRATGWGNERHYRFFKKGFVDWSSEIHSVPAVSGRILELPRHDGNEVRHDTARDLDHFFEKLLRYSNFEPDTMAAHGRPLSWQAAVDDARSELIQRWSVREDGTLSAVLSTGLYLYRLLAHFKHWERNGFPDVGAPESVETALAQLGERSSDEPLVHALAQSRAAEHGVRAQLEKERAQAAALYHELLAVREHLGRVETDYHRTITSRGWVALERARAARRRAAGTLALRRGGGGADAGATATSVAAPGVAPSSADAATILAGVAFAEASDPAVSIVIPVYNQIGYTARCLAAIAAAGATPSFEVIVVDDGSSDATPELLATVPGLRLHRNSSNLGFCGTVNNGAALARGRYLVLLNNDTEVKRDWLDTLVDVAESAPDIGAVGSKLIYGDGSLQEAGGIIWSDGHGWNYGRNDDPGKPVYNFRRDVDYCSAAAMLVRRDLFEQLGRFDLRFAPGYYEDTDLCFALRARGYRVVYQPHSEVVHHEGRTYGTDSGGAAVGQHTKQSQHRNREKFVEKWTAELSRQLPNGTAQGLLGGRSDRRPRVLVVDSWVPAHDQDSGSLRMTWILRLLADMGCHVTLYPQDRNPRQPYTANFQGRGIEVWYAPWSFRDLVEPRAGFYDVVVVSRAGVAEELMDDVRRFLPTAAVVYDTVDLHFVREGRRLEIIGVGEADDIARTKATELAAIRAADVTAAVTDTEAAMIREAEPAAHVVVLPNVHELPAEPPAGFAERHDLLFIGGFDHDPNVDAVHHLVRDVLPRVREQVPARLWVVGSNPPPQILAHHGDEVIVTGYLHDVADYFRMARVFVAPLRYGAGMKGKIGHALSMGLPVVTSTVGAEGMSLEDGRHALIRDDAESFAGAVVELYRDQQGWEVLSREGMELVQRCWTPAVMRERLQALMAELVPQRALLR
jgi:GT2 family glycosyltransferase